VDERSCHVENDECPNPREERDQGEGKKYEPHQQTPLWPAIISLFGESICWRTRGHIPISRNDLSGVGRSPVLPRGNVTKRSFESDRARITQRRRVLETKFQADIRLPLLGMVTDGRHEAA